MLLLAFGVTVGLCVARVTERVREYDDFRVHMARVRLAGAPSWMGGAEQEEFLRALQVDGDAMLRDAGLPEDVARRVEADPRVESVLDARRRWPDGVELLVELRRPAIVVHTPSGNVPADARGVRLPGGCPAGFPVVRWKGPVPAAGEAFPAAVAEAAAVAAAVPEDLRTSLGLEILETAPPPGDGKGSAPDPGVRLVREPAPGLPGVVVEWGRSPAAEDAALDPPPADKVARLRLAAERFPGLRGPGVVRLRFDDLVVTR